MPNNAKKPANKTKKKMMMAMAIGENTTACQCFSTYSHASPEEKKSFPFNCFNVTRLTAVADSRMKIIHVVIPM